MSEERGKDWRRERGEVSAVFLSSFDCACLDVSMSVPVLEFPVTTHFATAESRLHCGSSSLSDSIWREQEDPDSLSFRTQ